MACGPWHGMLLALAWLLPRDIIFATSEGHNFRKRQLPRDIIFATGGPRPWHGTRAEAVAWHSGLGMACLAKAKAWHAGQRCGMACWATPWQGMRAEAVALHAGRGRGMACGPRPWHGMLLALAWLLPRDIIFATSEGHNFRNRRAEAVARHAGRGRGMACWRRRWRGTQAIAKAWHAEQGRGVACRARPWRGALWPTLQDGMLAKAVARHAGEC